MCQVLEMSELSLIRKLQCDVMSHASPRVGMYRERFAGSQLLNTHMSPDWHRKVIVGCPQGGGQLFHYKRIEKLFLLPCRMTTFL